MLDLNSYLLYGLFMARRKELVEGLGAPRRETPAVRFNFVAWTLATLGGTLVKSGRKLEERYEPMVRTRPQTSN